MKQIPPVIKIIGISAAIFISWMVYDHYTEPEESRILKMFTAIEEGFESRKSAYVLEHISERFKDGLSNDKKSVGNLLKLFNHMTKSVLVSITRREIDVKDNKARCVMNFRAKVVGKANQTFTSNEDENGSGIIVFNLVKEDGDWRVIDVTYPPEVEVRVKQLQGM